MAMPEILAFIGQYGVPLVLLIALAFAYDRKEKKHEEERKRWEEQLKAERDACADEREAFGASLGQSYERERIAGDKFLNQILTSQANMTQVIADARLMAGAFETEKRELRETRERELREGGVRDTGQHRNPMLPKLPGDRR